MQALFRIRMKNLDILILWLSKIINLQTTIISSRLENQEKVLKLCWGGNKHIAKK